jgi:predicted branched-subunit amino acid permease
MAYNASMKTYSGTALTSQGPVSVRFLLTDEEFAYMMQPDVQALPADTSLVLEIIEVQMPELHDIHQMPEVVQ